MIVVVLMRVFVIVVMTVAVAPPTELQEDEADPGRDQETPYDRALGALDGRPELEPDGDDHPAENDRDQDMRDARQAGEASHP